MNATRPRPRPAGQALRGSREALIRWFSTRRRAYPWRTGHPDPYPVLVSEIMLQQTQASRVGPAYVAFLRRFPTLRSLAQASRGDVLRAWVGLGYNRRALALAEAARRIAGEHGGRVPDRPELLRTLPGVGPYTAAAVASVAFGMPVPAVDSNVARVVARALLGREADEVPRSLIIEGAAAWMDPARPSDWNQALMDLGREVCRPVPRCPMCPVSGTCLFRAGGLPGRRGGRRQPPYEGSLRQARGQVIRALVEHGPSTTRTLAGRSGQPIGRIAAAVAAMASEGMVMAGPAALAGNSRGRVRLPD